MLTHIFGYSEHFYCSAFFTRVGKSLCRSNELAMTARELHPIRAPAEATNFLMCCPELLIAASGQTCPAKQCNLLQCIIAD